LKEGLEESPCERFARAGYQDRQEWGLAAFGLGEVKGSANLGDVVWIAAAEQIGQEQGEAGFPGTVVTSNAPSALARARHSAAADAVEVRLNGRRDYVSV
jgi:hypothetical protein